METTPADLPLDPGVTDEDYWVSHYMMSMLRNFAATGNPSVWHLGVKWPAFTASEQYYLDIGYKPIVKTGYGELTEQQPPRQFNDNRSTETGP